MAYYKKHPASRAIMRFAGWFAYRLRPVNRGKVSVDEEQLTQEERRWRAEEAKATLYLEGLILTEEEESISQEWVEGSITLTEMRQKLMELPV